LDSDQRQLVKVQRRMWIVILAELEIVVRHRVAVKAVKREHEHHREVRQKHQRVKEVPVVKPFESLVRVLHSQVVVEGAFRSKSKKSRS
jgi:hypothetical protein